jgi:hypothetical protein
VNYDQRNVLIGLDEFNDLPRLLSRHRLCLPPVPARNAAVRLFAVVKVKAEGGLAVAILTDGVGLAIHLVYGNDDMVTVRINVGHFRTRMDREIKL